MTLTTLGLSLVVIAWLYEIYLVSRGHRGITKLFVGAYAAGVALLVYDGYTTGMGPMMYFNLASFLAALAVFFLLFKRRD